MRELLDRLANALHPTGRMRASAERIGVAGLSHAGWVRANNEDAFLADAALGLFVVCDGMGGHQYGEVASRLAVEQIHASVSGPRTLALEPPDGAPERSVLGRAITAAHARILDESASRELPIHMGTTVVSALVRGEHAVVANVGDSRAYLVSRRGDRMLSRDHTVAELYVEAGLIAAADVEHHPLRGVLVRCLGAPDGCTPDYQHTVFSAGDRLLLCSDGLTEMVEEPELFAMVRDGRDPESITEALIEAALAAGGEDNVTVVVVERGSGH